MTLIIISYRTRSIKLTKRLQPPQPPPPPHGSSVPVRPTIVTSKPAVPPAPLLVDVNRHNLSSILLFSPRMTRRAKHCCRRRSMINKTRISWLMGDVGGNENFVQPPSQQTAAARHIHEIHIISVVREKSTRRDLLYTRDISSSRVRTFFSKFKVGQWTPTDAYGHGDIQSVMVLHAWPMTHTIIRMLTETKPIGFQVMVLASN